MNLVDMLLKTVGGDAGKKIAGVIGEGEERTGLAVKAAVPALLAALANLASTSGGAQKLASAVEDADEGILGNLGNILGGQAPAVADKGSSLLNSLLSGGMLGNLSSVLGKFTGMNAGSITTLLATLAPVVLGLLKRETKSSGFDPGSLTRLLASQKENIANALPGGLGSMLAGIPGLGQFASLAQGARETVASGAERATTVGRQATSAASDATRALRWAVPLLVALALGWIAWSYFFAPGTPDRAAANRDVRRPVTSASAPTQVTAARITPEVAEQVSTVTMGVKDAFTDATETLTDVTDADSAAKAAEELPRITDRLQQLKNLADAIPEAQRKPILEMIRTSRGTLLTLIDRITKIPGVSAILAPHVGELKRALDAFGD